MSRRVVVTGLGVLSPNGVGVPAFLHAIQNGVSGIRFVPKYEELRFNCQVAGIPEFNWEDLRNYLPEVTFKSSTRRMDGCRVCHREYQNTMGYRLCFRQQRGRYRCYQKCN